MDPNSETHAALAALAWQIELGADEAISETPINRFELPAAEPRPAAAAPAAPRNAPDPAQPAPASASPAFVPAQPAAGPDPAEVAEAAARAAGTLEALAEAIAAFDLCELKRGARNTVVSDGNPKARLMIIGEAPGRDEDLQGRPFVGRAGQLLDRMLGAIGLSRNAPDAEHAAYITNVMFWRPPGNRDPSPEELSMLLPFTRRHIELAAPDVLILMGNTPCGALLGRRGILRLRGTWAEVMGRPVLPMTHPAYLLRNPAAKREAWADLLAVQAKLRELA
ncbi:uracil-DNA glycosylase [Solirhodobacter olei]|uniref:uracil-DNA glycosylase n=1 Tax=Solirhodobacter olei TaxID=2493082 RepID=UPI000FDC454B|nr:uracil-DNA glycosylase [Solirhodobacter olei]